MTIITCENNMKREMIGILVEKWPLETVGKGL
jgi:hypothetical protein